MTGGLGGGGPKSAQLEDMTHSPLCSTMVGGQKHPGTQSLGQPSGGVWLVHVGLQAGPHSEKSFPSGHTDEENGNRLHISALCV